MAEEEGPTRLKRSLSERLRRKSQVARGEAVPDMPETGLPPGADLPAEESEEEAALSDDELLAKYGVDDPESIEDQDKLDTLLQGQFPDRIRQMALRRMWRLNPLFRFADEMVEYGENYTDAATVIDGMQTAYQVGKGYLQKAFDAVDDDDAGTALADEADRSRLADDPSRRDEDDPAGKAEEDDKLASRDSNSDSDSDSDSDSAATAIEPAAPPGPANELAPPDPPAVRINDTDTQSDTGNDSEDDVPPPRPRRMSFRRPTDKSAA
ncbi:DUF3306 domain-containing protein [Alphaproteobacteria bacterium LSUCC0719]